MKMHAKVAQDNVRDDVGRSNGRLPANFDDGFESGLDQRSPSKERDAIVGSPG
jgi:hypothetical protein